MARKQFLISAVIVAVVAVASLCLWRARHQSPPPPVQIAVPVMPPASSSAAQSPAGASNRPETKQPLPPLIHGNPLTDERFASISAKIVIAALGLKRDKDWEVNTLLYMAKVLDAEGLSESDFTDYAQALNRNPDRGRAVAQRIMDKVEKKVGYRVTMETLPAFKINRERMRKVEKQLQEKLQ